MKVFQNILIGVDLTRCQPLALSSLSMARHSIRQGMDLAKANSAKIRFFAALNLSEDALNYLGETERARLSQAVVDGANRVLDELVKEAAAEGLAASGKLVLGKGWLEIIRQVLRDKHDLVVVGTRDLTGVRRLLFGNTAMKLLRRCPCPVFVSKAGTPLSPLNMLIATDLKPSSEEALRLGIAMAREFAGPVHVLHVVEYPLDRIWSTGLADSPETEYHRKVRAVAEKSLKEQLDTSDARALGKRLRIHLADGVGIPDVAIQHFIQVHNIHLLVMGTIGRGGIQGIMIGNTAERLLPEVHCSVLAVKPPDFQCPITLEG